MAREGTARTIFTIDGKQAINTLGKLELEASEIRNEMKGLKKNTQEYINLSKRQKEVTAGIKKQRQQLGLNGMTMRQLVNHQKDLKRELETTTTRGTKKYKELATQLKQVNNRLTQQRKALRGTQKSFNIFRSGMGKLVGMVGGVYALFNVLRSVYKTIEETQKAGSKLAAVLGTTSSAIQDLTKDAKEYGRTTQFTTKQVIELQTELAKLGFARQEIKELTKGVLEFAAAADTDLANAASVVGATVRAFNMEAKDAQRVVDVAAKSFSSSAFDIDKFSVAMAAAAPAANAAGLTIEQTTAQMGVLIDRGLDASTVGTSFRNMLLRSAAAGRTFEEQLDLIRNSADANATALELFGTRGATSALILADNAAAATELEEKLNGAAGAAESMAKEQLDNMAGAATRVSSAWDGFVLSLESGEGPLAQTITGVLELTAGLVGFLGAASSGGKTTMMEKILGGAPEEEAEKIKFLQQQYKAFSIGVDALQKQVDAINEKGKINRTLLGPRKRRFEQQIADMKAAMAQMDEIIQSGVRSEKRAAAEKERIARNLEKEKEKIRKEQAKKALEALAFAQRQEINALKLAHAEKRITTAQFQQEMAELELAQLMARKELITASGEELGNINTQILDAELSLKLIHVERMNQIEKDQTAFIKNELKERGKQQKDQRTKELAAMDRQVKQQLEARRIQEENATAIKLAQIDQQQATLLTAYIAGQSAVAQAESAEQAAVAVINAIRGIIQARMNEAVAETMKNVLSNVPFPLNIAAAATAAGAVNFLWNKILPPALTKQQKADRRQRKEQSEGTGRKKFYHGGDTGNNTTGQSDEYGQIAGVVHRNELVVPSYERSNPLVLNTEAQLAASNPKFRSNIDVNQVPSIGMTPEQAETMITEMRSMKSVLAQFPKELRAHVTWTDILQKQKDYQAAKGNQTI